MTRYILIFSLSLCSAAAQAQAGPCSGETIKAGKLLTSDDAFAYMPAYGKPAVGKSKMEEANNKSFSTRRNIKRSWADDHRIVPSASGDMAYEYGTLHITYDDSSPATKGHHEFDAVMLIVYKAHENSCQQVAMTMQPLE